MKKEPEKKAGGVPEPTRSTHLTAALAQAKARLVELDEFAAEALDQHADALIHTALTDEVLKEFGDKQQKQAAARSLLSKRIELWGRELAHAEKQEARDRAARIREELTDQLKQGGALRIRWNEAFNTLTEATRGFTELVRQFQTALYELDYLSRAYDVPRESFSEKLPVPSRDDLAPLVTACEVLRGETPDPWASAKAQLEAERVRLLPKPEWKVPEWKQESSESVINRQWQEEERVRRERRTLRSGPQPLPPALVLGPKLD
jgi:hypothetical protein